VDPQISDSLWICGLDARTLFRLKLKYDSRRAASTPERYDLAEAQEEGDRLERAELAQTGRWVVNACTRGVPDAATEHH
jgi:hypothetical protein